MTQARKAEHVQIYLRNRDREKLFPVAVDLSAPPRVVRDPNRKGPEVYLNWDQALDEQGYLRQCPVCGCTELFVRKDFPQIVGLGIVVIAAIAAFVLFVLKLVLIGLFVLAAVVVIDAVIFLFAGKRLTCYRCRSEFRDLPIRSDHPGWDLSVGEKYRPVQSKEPDA